MANSFMWLEGVFINTLMNFILPALVLYSIARSHRRVQWRKVLVMWLLIGQIGVSAGYHRYFTHEAFETSAVGTWVLGFLGLLSMQGTPGYWGAQHLVHHEKCETPSDPHSPVQHGLWHAHGGFLNGFVQKTVDQQESFRKNAVTMYQRPLHGAFFRHENYFSKIVWLGVPAATYTLFGGHAALWYLHVPQLISWHSTLSVNSAMHYFGYARPGHESDSCHARNVPWIWGISFGEAWHSNHHAKSSSASFEEQWWEVDPVFRLLQLAEKFGLVWNINTSTEVPPRDYQWRAAIENQASMDSVSCLFQMLTPLAVFMGLVMRGLHSKSCAQTLKNKLMGCNEDVAVMKSYMDMVADGKLLPH